MLSSGRVGSCSLQLLQCSLGGQELRDAAHGILCHCQPKDMEDLLHLGCTGVLGCGGGVKVAGGQQPWVHAEQLG